MNGRQRNATNAQIWGKKNDSNYDGNCTARHCLSGTYEISGRRIFVRLSVQLTVSSSTKHTERIATFALQQDLHDRTTTSRYMSTAYLVTLTDVRTTHSIFRLAFYITEMIQLKKFPKRSFYIFASTNHGMKNKGTEVASQRL